MINNKITNKEIDEIYNAMDALMKAQCWMFLDDFFKDLSLRVWRTDVDTLLSYATSTLPGKSKIPFRDKFIKTCKHIHPDVKLWKELE